MKRCLLKIVALLVLGAIVNVAVASACAVIGTGRGKARELPASEAHDLFRTYADSRWISHMNDRAFITSSWSHTVRGTSGALETRIPSVVGYRISERRFGVPMRSLQGVARWNLCSLETGGTRVEHLDSISWGNIQLPCRPLWPGFTLNTVFYAAILWLLFAAAFTLRRWRRIKRGLCPACAFPTGSSEVCTECGGAVNNKQARW